MVYSKIHVTVALSVIIFRFTLFRWILEHSLGLQTGHFQTYSQLKVSWGLQSSFWGVSGFQGRGSSLIESFFFWGVLMRTWVYSSEKSTSLEWHNLCTFDSCSYLLEQTTRRGRPVNRTKIQNSEAFHFVESLKLHGFHAKSCGTFIDM